MSSWAMPESCVRLLSLMLVYPKLGPQWIKGKALSSRPGSNKSRSKECNYQLSTTLDTLGLALIEEEGKVELESGNYRILNWGSEYLEVASGSVLPAAGLVARSSSSIRLASFIPIQFLWKWIDSLHPGSTLLFE